MEHFRTGWILVAEPSLGLASNEPKQLQQSTVQKVQVIVTFRVIPLLGSYPRFQSGFSFDLVHLWTFGLQWKRMDPSRGHRDEEQGLRVT